MTPSEIPTSIAIKSGPAIDLIFGSVVMLLTLGRRCGQCDSMAAMPLIEFVIPLFNEQESLHGFHKLLETTKLPENYARRYIYINDGSTDETPAILNELSAANE